MSKGESLRAAGAKTWIGVDIGGTKTAVMLCAQPPTVFARVEFPTLPEQGPERALELIKKTIHELIRRYRQKIGKLEAIGVSCGGPLDRVAGIIQAPPNLSVALMCGLGFSGFLHWQTAVAMLVAFLLLSSESYLATYTLSCFQLSQGLFGPTEIRILLIIGNLAPLRNQYAT